MKGELTLTLKRIFIVGIVCIAVLSVALLFFMVEREEVRAAQIEHVVVIHLQGPIQESGGGFGAVHGITPRHVARQLDRAAADLSIRAVVLRVNSPGGTVAASQQIAAMIENFEKPIVVSMGDMATSGGYYISAPADGIVAHPGTITGSIGVIMTTFNLQGLHEKLGIEVEVIRSGEHKDMFQRDLTNEERQLLQDLSDEIHGQFIGVVVEGRGLDVGRVRELATGEIFVGSQALKYELVDRLGGIEEAIAFAAEIAGLEDPVRYEFPPPTLFEQFFEFSVNVPGIIEKIFIPSELILLERLKQGIHPEFRF